MYSYYLNKREVEEASFDVCNNQLYPHDMFHLLFDLAGINSPFYQETKSVINDNYAPREKRFLLMGEGLMRIL